MTDLSSPERMSHAVLIAVLMHHSDSIDLPDDALDTDALGTVDGTHHAVQLTRLDTGTVRLSVIARSPGDAARIEVHDPWVLSTPTP